jgi:hypothetical protein
MNLQELFPILAAGIGFKHVNFDTNLIGRLIYLKSFKDLQHKIKLSFLPPHLKFD